MTDEKKLKDLEPTEKEDPKGGLQWDCFGRQGPELGKVGGAVGQNSIQWDCFGRQGPELRTAKGSFSKLKK